MIVSYCTGIGGLDLAAERVFGTHTEHTFEVDRHAGTVLAARFPNAERWGDLSGDDTAGIQAGDDTIVTAGFPCQDISLAGKGAGLDGERSGLWFTILDHVETVRPEWVAVENVPALAKRGLDVVLEGLTAAGYGGAWTFWRAGYRSKNRQAFPHVCAPHQRKRLFILARRGYEWDTVTQADTGQFRQVEAAFADPTGDVDTLSPTPAASSYGFNQGGAAGRVGPKRYGLDNIDKLLSTPTAWLGRRPGNSDLSNPESFDRGSGKELTRDIAKLLPTPTATDAKGSRNATDLNPGSPDHPTGRKAGTTLNDVAFADKWGDYAAAITRWEAQIGRPAPEPTSSGRLSPAFVEWMMGFPAGWVTDLDIPRTQQLKMLGNAVVPQQATAALTYLKTRMAQ